LLIPRSPIFKKPARSQKWCHVIPVFLAPPQLWKTTFHPRQSRTNPPSPAKSHRCHVIPVLTLRQAAEKLFSEGVILSEAKDLLSARAESKADPKRKIGATSG
jgi:hypothetical protein